MVTTQDVAEFWGIIRGATPRVVFSEWPWHMYFLTWGQQVEAMIAILSLARLKTQLNKFIDELDAVGGWSRLM